MGKLDKALVALCELGLGTGRAAVYDERDGVAVWFDLGRPVLVGSVVCVRVQVADTDGGLVRVVLPGGRHCWARRYRPAKGAAA